MSKDKKTAIEAAAAYLANRMRTSHEVRLRLKEREYSDDEAEEAIKELEQLGYLNDREYALRYFEYNREKRRGSQRAVRELLQKGVDEETVRYSREDYLHEQKVDEFEDALYVARREAEGKTPDEKLNARIARKLEARGFEKRDIIRVLEALKSRL